MEERKRCFYFFALPFTLHRSPLSERLEQAKNDKVFVLRHLFPVHEVLTGIWKLSIDIWTNCQINYSFAQGKCTFDCTCQPGNFKNYDSRNHACLNKLMHIEN